MTVLAALFAPLIARIVAGFASNALKVGSWVVMILVLAGCLYGLWHNTDVAVKVLLTVETIDLVAIYLSAAGVFKFPALPIPAPKTTHGPRAHTL